MKPTEMDKILRDVEASIRNAVLGDGDIGRLRDVLDRGDHIGRADAYALLAFEAIQVGADAARVENHATFFPR